MKDVKSLNDIAQTSVDVKEPKKEYNIIPKVGGPDGNTELITDDDLPSEDSGAINTGDSRGYSGDGESKQDQEQVSPYEADIDIENPLTQEEMEAVDQINNIAKEKFGSGISLDFSEMFNRMGREKQNIYKEAAKIQEEEEADAMIENTIGESDNIPEPIIANYAKNESNDKNNHIDKPNLPNQDVIELLSDTSDVEDVNNIPQSAFDLPDDFIEKVINEEDDDVDLDEFDEEEYEKTRIESAKNAGKRLKELLKDTEDKFDENRAFTISKRPITINNFLNKKKEESHYETHEADWVLMASGKKITMSALSANEIEKLDVNNSSKSRLRAIEDVYRIIYDHITSQKPDFEFWIKSELAADIEHYYMCAYRATFEHANHYVRQCRSCGNVFLTENIDIFDMVEFDDDESKKRFYDILNGTENQEPIIETRVLPISETVAVGLKEPTIYSAIYENQAMPQSFIRTHQDMMFIISYIDNFYIVEDDEFKPLYTKVYPNDIAKTIRYKVASFCTVINNLSSDEYGKLISYISAIANKETPITYRYKNVKCPKCNELVEEDKNDHNAISLLFKRHRLVTMTNSLAR